jgi:hypothetical protein
VGLRPLPRGLGRRRGNVLQPTPAGHRRRHAGVRRLPGDDAVPRGRAPAARALRRVGRPAVPRREDPHDQASSGSAPQTTPTRGPAPRDPDPRTAPAPRCGTGRLRVIRTGSEASPVPRPGSDPVAEDPVAAAAARRRSRATPRTSPRRQCPCGGALGSAGVRAGSRGSWAPSRAGPALVPRWSRESRHSAGIRGQQR